MFSVGVAYLLREIVREVMFGKQVNGGPFYKFLWQSNQQDLICVLIVVLHNCIIL